MSVDEGCMLGHIDVMLNQNRTVGARVSTRSQCIVLSMRSVIFKKLMRKYPEDHALIVNGFVSVRVTSNV
jgi:hypothetical protein